MQSFKTKSSRPRPKSFKSETRSETFETETSKNGSRDMSRDRDQVSRLNHCNRITSNIFKTCFYRMSKFTWMKQFFTILFFEIESSAFVLSKSLTLSPLNPKYLENQLDLSCEEKSN